MTVPSEMNAVSSGLCTVAVCNFVLWYTAHRIIWYHFRIDIVTFWCESVLCHMPYHWVQTIPFISLCSFFISFKGVNNFVFVMEDCTFVLYPAYSTTSGYNMLLATEVTKTSVWLPFRGATGFSLLMDTCRLLTSHFLPHILFLMFLFICKQV